MTIETDDVDAATLPVVKEKAEQKPKSPKGGRRGDREGLNEAALEREFKNFAIKARKQFGEDVVAYQVSNYPEGLEFSVRVAKSLGREGARFTRTFDSYPNTEKKEIVKKKEMTDEQKAKRAEKQARRREYLEKKRQERLENADKDTNVDPEVSGNEEPNADGDSAKESQ